ncbi:hypothetical protein RN001_011736 [Aquatica leii]|uniref:Uncharacterized protein n=1 Tax=Aquatica leii TaxID=1421715 RepID=A0AAN7PS51_9COLE|nr:hypothetical protein RN001_011736 [Aquatica leii]
MSGARNGIPRFSGSTASNRNTNSATSLTRTSQTHHGNSRIPQPSSRIDQTQSRLPVLVRSSNTQTQNSRVPARTIISSQTSRTTIKPGKTIITSQTSRTTLRPSARPVQTAPTRNLPNVQTRHGSSARSHPASKSAYGAQRGVYGPGTQIVNVVQGGSGAVPKTTIKTVKTKKVETSGNKTKTTTTTTKSYKPFHNSGPKTDSCGIPALFVDVSKDLVAPVSSLEQVVEKQLLEKLSKSSGVPVRAKGARKTETVPPVITTAEGETVQGTLQIHLDRLVERSPEIEYIKRYMTGVEVGEQGAAKKYEYSIQEAEPYPSISPRPDGVVPLREVISVKSTISFAPGVREKVSTTIYESTEPDPVEVSQLIEEEAREVDRINRIPPPEVKGSPSNIYPIKKKLQQMQLNPESVRMLEKSVDLPPVSPDEPREELAPEIMAAIMHTEERGLNMETAPSNVCNYLFPNVQDDLVINVKPVAPKPMQQVVVPEQIPSELLIEGVPAEIESIAQDAKTCCCRQPTDNIYSSSILKERPPKVYNMAERGQPGRKGYPILSEEQPPWSSKDLQPIMDLVGAGPTSPIRVVEPSSDDPNTTPIFYHNESENVLEYHLIPQPPRFISNVQLRGSQKPSWFPGYYMALPDNIRVVTSPCDVLPAAWQAVQPDIFAEDSFLIIE